MLSFIIFVYMDADEEKEQNSEKNVVTDPLPSESEIDGVGTILASFPSKGSSCSVADAAASADAEDAVASGVDAAAEATSEIGSFFEGLFDAF